MSKMTDSLRKIGAELEVEGYTVKGLRVEHAADHIEALEAELAATKAEVERLREALSGLLTFAEDAESKMLVGDEGCVWAVELARATLAREARDDG